MGAATSTEPISKVHDQVKSAKRQRDTDCDPMVGRQRTYPAAEMSNQSALRMAGSSIPLARMLRPSQRPILQRTESELATAATAPPNGTLPSLTPKAPSVARQASEDAPKDLRAIDQQIAILSASLRNPLVAMSPKAKAILDRLIELGKQHSQLLIWTRTVEQDGPIPTLRPGQTWALPETARLYLPNYEQRLQNMRYEMSVLIPLQYDALRESQTAIAIQDRARTELDDISKNDIWPNWGTLNHVLTAGGVLVSCLDSACVVGAATGIVSFIDTDSGAVAGVATSCIPDPLKPGCAAAISAGAASMVADRKDKSATTVRRSAKEEAQLALELGKKAQLAADIKLDAILIQLDVLDDNIFYLQKTYDYAKWGRESDNPLNQVYKTFRVNDGLR